MEGSSLKFNRELVLIRVFSGGMADEQVQLFLTAILATLVNEIIDFGMWFAYAFDIISFLSHTQRNGTTKI